MRYRQFVAISVLLLGVGMTQIPLVEAATQTLAQVHPSPMRSCQVPVRRFLTGHGRRPGLTVIPVDLRLQIRNAAGAFVYAGSDSTIEAVQGDEVALRVLVTNRSLYDVGGVSLVLEFTPSPLGSPPEGIGSIRGAVYDEQTRRLLIERIASDETAEVTLRLFFPREIPSELSQALVRLEDFSVLESERRFPEKDAVTELGRSRQTVERVGIGSTDVVCFVGSGSDRSYEQRRGGVGAAAVQPPPQAMEKSGELTFRKSANTAEARPGMSVVYTLLLQNQTNTVLRDIVVDDRFSPDQVSVLDPAGGRLIGSGVQWTITQLQPREQWIKRYTLRVGDHVRSGDRIPNTMTLVSQELLDFPTAKRQVTVEIAVISDMPETGVDLTLLFGAAQGLAGVVILGGSLFVARRLRTRGV